MLKRFYTTLALTALTVYYCYPQQYTISGTILEKGSRESLIGVYIYVEEKKTGTTTNNYGFYAITLPASDNLTVVFSYVGFQSVTKTLKLNQNITINLEMESNLELETVEVYGNQPKTSSRSAQTSVVELPMRQVKSIPALLGEKDVLKVMQLMPGVQSGSEGNSGLYVRGGAPDQNLIILDDATVYNAFHLFGFFSLFNGDAIKSTELIKGGFPARYGGRLSSVMDIVMKDGNKEEIHGEAGIGILSSRLVLEGPIMKDKASFLVSARRSYADLLARPFMLAQDPNAYGGYFFYDLTAKANWEIDSRNKVFISSYFGRDKFYMKNTEPNNKSSVGMFWDNATATLRWNRIFTDELFSNLSLIFSNYRFKIFSESQNDGFNFTLNYLSGIRDYGLKYDFSWYPAPMHTVRFGLLSTLHEYRPSAMVIKDSQSNFNQSNILVFRNLESSLYCEDEIRVGSIGTANIGVRLSSHYLNFKTIKAHVEPRASLTFFLNDRMSIKASYAMMNQYMHLLSNTGIGLPTDLWVPATENAPAQKSWQAVLGYTYDIPKYSTTLSVEGYYKGSSGIITYKPGANFLLLNVDIENMDINSVNWEDNITSGTGKSYGVEFLAHKKAGKFSGWVGYTLSWIKHRFDMINNGREYYPKYDRRHDISIVGIYEITPRITLSTTWVYGTGNAVSLPLNNYYAPTHQPGGNNYSNSGIGSQFVSYYGEKNTFRMAPYHRLDVGIQFHKQKKHYHRTWEISAYNVYNRHNPFYYMSDKEYKGNGDIQWKLKQVSIFPIIPSISWSIKF